MIQEPKEKFCCDCRFYVDTGDCSDCALIYLPGRDLFASCFALNEGKYDCKCKYFRNAYSDTDVAKAVKALRDAQKNGTATDEMEREVDELIDYIVSAGDLIVSDADMEMVKADRER